ncbi:hypothetical protein TRVA0_057S00342 [Trichomonascus vanleenenianus]|uniref:uncharacterized protein n=1 Tax=Trichomonascus vanleenenianus TaxID=2268995 RepID=UPI003ECB7BEA
MTRNGAQIVFTDDDIQIYLESLMDQCLAYIHRATWGADIECSGPLRFAHLGKLHDDIDSMRPGYWFKEDNKNLFLYSDEKEKTGTTLQKKRFDYCEMVLYDHIKQAALRGKISHGDAVRLLSTDDSDEMDDQTRIVYEKKLEEMQIVESLILLLIQATIPGPEAPVDFLNIRYKNTVEEKRNLFVENNVLMFIDDYGVSRYFSWIVGEIIIRYLTLVRPLQMRLARFCEDDYIRKRLETYLIAYPWSKEQVETIVSESTHRFLSKSISVSDWRNQMVHDPLDHLRIYEKWRHYPDDENLAGISFKCSKILETQGPLHSIGVKYCVKHFAKSSILPFNKK